MTMATAFRTVISTDEVFGSAPRLRRVVADFLVAMSC
jgi:hypothetical protein